MSSESAFSVGRRALEEQKIPKDDREVLPDQNWKFFNHALTRYDASFTPRAPWTSITSAEWPPKPNNAGKRVDLGPLVSKIDAKLAHAFWRLADDTLGDAWRNRPNHSPTPESEEPGLARNVYEHMMIFAVLPLAYKEARDIFVEEGLQQTWDGAAIVGSMKDEIIAESPIRGVINWSKQSIQNELKTRKVSLRGNLPELRARLINDELHKHCGVMPVSDLVHWGLQRPNKYILQPAANKAMTPIDMYTFALHLSPYNPIYWLSRAYCHYQQGHFDLAIGDAYRAQIICNTIEQTKDRYSKDGFYTHIYYAVEQHILADPTDEDGCWTAEVDVMRKPQGIHPFVSAIQKTLLNIICLSLEALNCWDDYDAYNRQLAARINRLYLERFVADLRKRVSKKAEKAWRKKRQRPGLFWFERYQGAVPAEKAYPYKKDDILDLFPAKEKLLAKLTKQFFQHEIDDQEEGPKVPTDNCEVRLAPNKEGLGVVAKRHIKKGDLIHFEEPTIRGHLPPRRLIKDKSQTPSVDDTRCENCQVKVNDRIRRPSVDDNSEESDEYPKCGCSTEWTRNPNDKRGLMFCPSNSREETCFNIGHLLYHNDGCGRDWKWLYDTMRPNIWEWDNMEHISHSNEVHGTYLSLLLRSVVEITLLRREDDNNPSLAPQEIDELLVLSGNSKSWRESWFPFTMSANIIVPFDIITFLGVNIFRDLSFDTWAIQVILRKLLVNAVPWDMKRREDVPAVLNTDEDKRLENPIQKTKRIQNGYSFKDWDPSFMNLYLFPGFSMFNHTCSGAQNAEWAYDTQIANRVIVWADKDIKAGEEICIRYQNKEIQSKHDALQLFGGPCLCPKIDGHGDTNQESDKDSQLYESDETSSEKRSMGESEQTEQKISFRRSGESFTRGTKRKSATEKAEDEDEGEEDEDESPPKKRKYIEHAHVENDRVAIRRLLTLEEEMEENKRAEFKVRKAGSMDIKEQEREKNAYLPFVEKKKNEDRKEWLARERKALRKDREGNRYRETTDEDPTMKTQVPQIAREPGQPIKIVEVVVPDLVGHLDHKRRRRRR